MKKIFTLVCGSLLALAVSAAGHRPTVTVNSSRNYEIVIDGRSYQNSNNLNLSFLREGNHSIQVYQANRGFFFQKRNRMVASSGFRLRNNDIMIYVDMYGQIRIAESRSRFDMDDRGRNDRGWGNNQDRDDNRGYDKDRGNDRGNNQGHDENKGYDKDHGKVKNDRNRRF